MRVDEELRVCRSAYVFGFLCTPHRLNHMLTTYHVTVAGAGKVCVIWLAAMGFASQGLTPPLAATDSFANATTVARAGPERANNISRRASWTTIWECVCESNVCVCEWVCVVVLLLFLVAGVWVGVLCVWGRLFVCNLWLCA